MHSRTRLNVMQILLVEDNPGDAMLVQEAFCECGIDCRFIIASDGESALDMLQAEASIAPVVQPDLILLDLNLPRRNGHEVLRDLKANCHLCLIPVVVLTSSSAEGDVALAYRLHGNAYFRKPSSFTEYVQTAKAILEFWMHAELPCGAASTP